MQIPWWAWLIIILLVGAFVLYRVALKSMSRMFRSASRTYLTNIMQVLDPNLVVEDVPINRLRGTFLGKHIDVDLEPYFAAATQTLNSHPLRGQVTVFEFLKDSLPDQGALVSRERHRSWIRPKLITSADLLMRQQITSLPSTPLGDTGLHVIYVVDGAKAPIVFAITAEYLSPLGFSSAAELHQHAVDELLPHTPQEAIETVLKQGEISALGMHDGYVAARILAVQKLLGPNESLVALIPDLNSCVLIPLPQNGDWNPIREGARTPLHEGEMLLDQPVLVTHDAIQLVRAASFVETEG